MATRIAYLNSPYGDPEAHSPDCADIPKKQRRGFDLAGYAEVDSIREVSLDYNADFIDDGAEERDLWNVMIMPCTGL